MMSQALGGGEFALRLVPGQRVSPLYWRSSSHTHTHTHIFLSKDMIEIHNSAMSLHELGVDLEQEDNATVFF